MRKKNNDLLLKILGIGLTIAGTVITTISSEKENKKQIEEFCKEELNKQKEES